MPAPHSYSDSSDPSPASKDSLLGWSIFLVLLVGFVALCWLGSFYIFGHPEQPFSYSILQKLGRIDPPQRFQETAAPRGEFLSAKSLLERYGSKTRYELQQISQRLLRSYIRNYKQNKDLVPYIVGKFVILDSYELNQDAFIQSGVVALAQSPETPQVLVEVIFPAPLRTVPALHRTLLTGLDLPNMRRGYELFAILNVEYTSEGRLKFTTIPINYPDYMGRQGSGDLALEPPKELNIQAGLPVLSTQQVRNAEAHYTAYLRMLGLDQVAEAPEALPGDTSMTRVQAAAQAIVKKPAPTPQASQTTPPADLPSKPAIAVAQPANQTAPSVQRAIPVAEAANAPASEEPASQAQAAVAVRAAMPVQATPTPMPSEPPVARAVAPEEIGAPVPNPNAPPLRPYLATSQNTGQTVENQSNQPASASQQGQWQTFAPGQMPRGRLMRSNDAKSLLKTGVQNKTYLQGDFAVSAARANRAVLRPKGNADKVRVIVDFPAGTRAPGEGATVSRNAQRPFEVYRVEEADDGTVNVWAREVTGL